MLLTGTLSQAGASMAGMRRESDADRAVAAVLRRQGGLRQRRPEGPRGHYRTGLTPAGRGSWLPPRHPRRRQPCPRIIRATASFPHPNPSPASSRATSRSDSDHHETTATGPPRGRLRKPPQPRP